MAAVTFDIGLKTKVSRLWHCFGLERNPIGLKEVCSLLNVRASNVLIAETHSLRSDSGEADLELGFGGVKLRDVCRHVDIHSMHLVANIAGQRSAHDVFERCRLVSELCDVALYKIETLREGGAVPRNEEVLRAVYQIRSWSPGIRIAPLIFPDVEVARRLIELKCFMLRVTGAPIGSRRGVLYPSILSEICGLGTPVILDGGVGVPSHYKTARDLGASGVLINSALFSGDVESSSVLRRFATAVCSFERRRGGEEI